MLRKIAKAAAPGGGAPKDSVPLSVIGPDVRIVGDIRTQGEMQIDGLVEGDISCQTLVVGEGARISGEVTADTVRVHGEVAGKIVAATIVIARSAKVTGDITHDSLEIEAGAQIEGHILRKGTQPAGKKAEMVLPSSARKANGAHPPAPAPVPAIEPPAEASAAS